MRRLDSVLNHLSPDVAVPAAAVDDEKEFLRLRTAFLSGKTRKFGWRRQQLTQLVAALEKNKSVLVDAVCRDFNKKNTHENRLTLALAISETKELLAHFETWARPEQVRSSIAQWPCRSEVRKEPKGVVLAMSPWNYPLNLAIVPIAGALAAGNAVFIKLSRHSPHASSALAKVLREALDPEATFVEHEGGAEFITKILRHPWNHIFFTGSVDVGKVVATAAAKHLTSYTLELGGKNPAVIFPDANIDLAGRRLAWAKTFNAGQTCIAPDYVLCVGKGTAKEFVEAFGRHLESFYGKDISKSDSFGRIIHKAAFTRLQGLLKEGTILLGGQQDANQLFIAPTIIKLEAHEIASSQLMKFEVFGPLLPLIELPDDAAVVDFVQRRDIPLALHAFSRDEQRLKRLFNATQSGSANGNDAALMIFANPRLPFGGAGASGVGNYHGKRTFDALSDERATTYSTSSSWLDHVVHRFVYPPYSEPFTQIAEWLIWSGL